MCFSLGLCVEGNVVQNDMLERPRRDEQRQLKLGRDVFGLSLGPRLGLFTCGQGGRQAREGCRGCNT
jgi:hypothetical protein